MGLTSTLYRFQIDLSDVDRGIYQNLEFRAAMHPSESMPFFITRVLAFCLNYEESLEFSPGISAPDEPALRVTGLTGQVELWIDIGNPTPKRIHKASKTGAQIILYTHKDAQMLARELKEAEVHRLEDIQLYAMDQRFLHQLGATLQRDNRWEITHHEGQLYIGVGKESFQAPIASIPLTK